MWHVATEERPGIISALPTGFFAQNITQQNYNAVFNRAYRRRLHKLQLQGKLEPRHIPEWSWPFLEAAVTADEDETNEDEHEEPLPS